MRQTLVRLGFTVPMAAVGNVVHLTAHEFCLLDKGMSTGGIILLVIIIIIVVSIILYLILVLEYS